MSKLFKTNTFKIYLNDELVQVIEFSKHRTNIQIKKVLVKYTKGGYHWEPVNPSPEHSYDFTHYYND